MWVLHHKYSGPVGRGKSPCAYCLLHHATLTVRQMKRHKCREKNCRHFRKYAQHGYWLSKPKTKKKKPPQPQV